MGIDELRQQVTLHEVMICLPAVIVTLTPCCTARVEVDQPNPLPSGAIYVRRACPDCGQTYVAALTKQRGSFYGVEWGKMLQGV